MDRAEQLTPAEEKQELRDKVRWKSGYPETVCGKGSMFENTEQLRKYIPQVIEKCGIKTVADIGCGDQNWIHHAIPDAESCGIKYVGYDIKPRFPDVVPFDVTKQVLPTGYDLVLLIAVLNHLKPDQAERALKLIQMSGSKYLLMTYTDIDQYAVPPLLIESEFVRTRTRQGESPFDAHLGLWKL